jgi:hypothetical protein
VLLYATDATRAAALVQAAARAHPAIATGLVRIVRAAYSEKTLHARIMQIMAGNATATAADLTIYGASPATDGSGIDLSVKPSAVAQVGMEMTANAAAGAIPVTVTPGTPVRFDSVYWRWNDSYPLVSGDVLLGNGHGGGHTQCTSGLAAENSAGRDYLLTADHCFKTGSQVWGEGATPPGNWNSYADFGNYFGVDIGGYDTYDEALIDTGKYNGVGTTSLEADQPAGTYYQVTSDFGAGVGQGLCQDGTHSYYDFSDVPCNAVVYKTDYMFTGQWDDGTTHTADGVLTRSTGYIAEPGDSGALVFDVTGAATRNAVGMVSAGWSAGVYNYMLYVRATDVLSHYNLHLNPN